MTWRGGGSMWLFAVRSVQNFISPAATVVYGPPLEITHVWRVRQEAQSRCCVTPVIQVTARRLCLSCQTDVTAIETDDRLLAGYKPSMIGYGKKTTFTTLIIIIIVSTGQCGIVVLCELHDRCGQHVIESDWKIEILTFSNNHIIYISY